MDDGLGEDEVDVRDRCRVHCPSWHLQLHVRALFDLLATLHLHRRSLGLLDTYGLQGKRLSQRGFSWQTCGSGSG